MKRVAIIEDDIEISKGLALYLTKNQYHVEIFNHPQDALDVIQKNPFDLILLDLMLPDIDGFDVCRRIRSNKQVPIIMLTARGDLADKVVGLELGADDYLSKPFEPRELLARMNAVLRRVASSASTEEKGDNDSILFGEFCLNSKQRSLSHKDSIIELTTHEFDLLELLLRASGKVLSRDEIMNELHGVDRDFFSRSIDVNISRLRQKLNDNPKRPQIIKTVWGKGYQLVREKK